MKIRIKNIGILLLFILFIGLCINVQSQIRMSFSGKIRDTLSVEKYIPNDTAFDMCILKMEQGDYRILNPKECENAAKSTITLIELVYTDYPKEQDFTELNRKRLIELFMYLPKAFKNSAVNWRIVRQTGVKSKSDLKKYLHGIVVHYIKYIPPENEIKYLKNVLSGKEKITDSSIIKVINRNPDWKDMPVVIDATGSMSPYTAQLLVWLKLNSMDKKFKDFVFFNDFENGSSTNFNINQEPGIFPVSNHNIDSILFTAAEAMSTGGGEEFNFKSVIFAASKFKQASKKGILMIADNYQTPLDMQNMKEFIKLNIPLHIIVCGSETELNKEYLNIARATKGSIHTMEKSIKDLVKLKEGSIVDFGKYRFKIQNGFFVKLNLQRA